MRIAFITNTTCNETLVPAEMMERSLQFFMDRRGIRGTASEYYAFDSEGNVVYGVTIGVEGLSYKQFGKMVRTMRTLCRSLYGKDNIALERY